MRVTIQIAGVVVVGCVWLVRLSGQSAEKIVPVHEEPRHRLVFDSPGTRILDINVPPGDTTLFHTHSNPILYVNMSASQMRNQTLGGEWSRPDASQGATQQPAISQPPPRPGRMMSTTSYAQQPLTHRVNNVGQTLYRLIGVINYSAGDDSTARSLGFDVAPEISNPWFRGYRWPPPTPTTSTRIQWRSFSFRGRRSRRAQPKRSR